MQHDESQYMPAYWFSPVLPSWENVQMRAGRNFLLFNGMPALTTHLLSKDVEDTSCEIAGGEARTTRVLIRFNNQRVTTGPNVDLVADADLTAQREQQAFWEYRRKRKPKVCVMAPMCRSFGGRSRMNRLLHPETYEHHLHTVDGPLAKFAGQVCFGTALRPLGLR